MAGNDPKSDHMGNPIGGGGVAIGDLHPRVAYTDLREWLAEAEKLGEVREAMYGLGCAHGLVFDDQHYEVLRDTYETTGPDAIKVDAVLETPRLLANGGGSLEGRLVRWLDALTRSGTRAIPREPWAAALLADVVPAASGTVVRRTMSLEPA